jgi:hypothetical protein
MDYMVVFQIIICTVIFFETGINHKTSFGHAELCYPYPLSTGY